MTRSAAWWIAAWIDVAAGAPFDMRDLIAAMEPTWGQCEVEYVRRALVAARLIRRVRGRSHEWTAAGRLAGRVESLRAGS